MNPMYLQISSYPIQLVSLCNKELLLIIQHHDDFLIFFLYPSAVLIMLKQLSELFLPVRFCSRLRTGIIEVVHLNYSLLFIQSFSYFAFKRK